MRYISASRFIGDGVWAQSFELPKGAYLERYFS